LPEVLLTKGAQKTHFFVIYGCLNPRLQPMEETHFLGIFLLHWDEVDKSGEGLNIPS